MCATAPRMLSQKSITRSALKYARRRTRAHILCSVVIYFRVEGGTASAFFLSVLVLVCRRESDERISGRRLVYERVGGVISEKIRGYVTTTASAAAARRCRSFSFCMSRLLGGPNGINCLLKAHLKRPFCDDDEHSRARIVCDNNLPVFLVYCRLQRRRQRRQRRRRAVAARR